MPHLKATADPHLVLNGHLDEARFNFNTDMVLTTTEWMRRRYREEEDVRSKHGAVRVIVANGVPQKC